MRPSFWFLGYMHLFYPLLFKSGHFSYGWTLICQTYSTSCKMAILKKSDHGRKFWKECLIIQILPKIWHPWQPWVCIYMEMGYIYRLNSPHFLMCHMKGCLLIWTHLKNKTCLKSLAFINSPWRLCRASNLSFSAWTVACKFPPKRPSVWPSSIISSILSSVKFVIPVIFAAFINVALDFFRNSNCDSLYVLQTSENRLVCDATWVILSLWLELGFLVVALFQMH